MKRKAMESVEDEASLQERIAGPALLVLFGGADCGVCQAIKPRIEREMAERFPGVSLAYVDCHAAARVCAQQGVFSLPVLRFYVQGRLGFEKARSFSLVECMADMERLVQLAAPSGADAGCGAVAP